MSTLAPGSSVLLESMIASRVVLWCCLLFDKFCVLVPAVAGLLVVMGAWLGLACLVLLLPVTVSI